MSFGMNPAAQASPVLTEQSCIELHMFGSIIVNLAERFGVDVNGTSLVAHDVKSVKYAAGLCFTAY